MAMKIKEKNKMNRDEFISKCWNYYKNLEDDFVNLRKYVKIDKKNFRTCSDEIVKQFYTICAEIDVLFKLVCGIELSRNSNIIGYYNIIEKDYKEIFNATISVLHTNIIIKPFKKWKVKTEDGKNILIWWQVYGNTKHNRVENYKDANFKNLLDSLAALYYLELFLIRRIGAENGEMDVPNSVSKIFELKNFKTKHKVTGDEMYPMTQEEIDEILNS